MPGDLNPWLAAAQLTHPNDHHGPDRGRSTVHAKQRRLAEHLCNAEDRYVAS